MTGHLWVRQGSYFGWAGVRPAFLPFQESVGRAGLDDRVTWLASDSRLFNP